MGSNPKNFQSSLLRSMVNTAQANNAKYGGYGQGGNFGNYLIQGLKAAFPNSPLFNAVGAINTARNVQGYNKYLQQQAQAAAAYQQQRQAQEDQNNAAIYEARTGQHLNGHFDTNFANQSAGDIRKSNAFSDIQNLMNTGQFDMTNPNADYGNIPEMLLKRTGEGNDAYQTLEQMPDFIGAQPKAQAQQPILNDGISQLQDEVPLQAGVNYQRGLTPANIMNVGIPNVDQLLTGRSDAQDYQLGQGKLEESTRHHKANEGNTRQKNQYDYRVGQANARAHQTSANASAQNAGTNAAQLKEQQRQGYWKRPSSGSNIPQKQFTSQLKAIDSELQQMGYLNKKTGKLSMPGNTSASDGFYGFGGVSQEDAAKNARALQLIKTRQQINNQVLGAFGGNSQQSLQNAGTKSGFAAWKNKK